MAFKKGQSGNPQGRPEGSKNKNYTNVNCWLELIWERIPAMTPEDQIKNAWRAIDSLLPKVPTLPATQEDSRQNAGNAFNLMNGLAPIPTPPESNPRPTGSEPLNGNGSNGAA